MENIKIGYIPVRQAIKIENKALKFKKIILIKVLCLADLSNIEFT